MSKCPTCNDEFSEEYRIPKVLPCGHTYCMICLVTIFQGQKTFICLECRYAITDPSVFPKLPHNFAILKCIQQMKIHKSLEHSPSGFFSQSGSNPFLEMQDTTNFSPSFDTFRSFSPAKMGPLSDSFNFNGFKASLDGPGGQRERALSRSFTMPRERSKTPPRRVDDFEINEKGIFREKTPQRVKDLCNIKECNNEKMYMQGSLQAFCQFHFMQFQGLNTMGGGWKNPNIILQGQMHPQQQAAFMSLSQSQALNNSMNNSNMPTMHNSTSLQGVLHNSQQSGMPMNINQSMYKFGKTNELMNYYDGTPANVKHSGGQHLSQSVGAINNSMFSGFDGNQSQSIDFGKLNLGKHAMNPFPNMSQEKLSTNKQVNPSNKCQIEECQNPRCTRGGVVMPFCSNKCYVKLQQQFQKAQGVPFWT